MNVNVATMLLTHPYFNYYGTPNYISSGDLNIHNSLGFRGPETQTPKSGDTYRIVAIGGSTTYSTEVKDWTEDFARVLEKELNDRYQGKNIEVINAGVLSTV